MKTKNLRKHRAVTAAGGRSQVEVPPQGFSSRMAKSRALAIERRKSLASSLRASLLARLGDSADGVQRSLIDLAASSYAEVQELTRYFELAQITTAQLQRLAIVRGSMLRALKALGVTDDSPAEQDAPPLGASAGDPARESVEQVVARFGGSPKPQEVAHAASEAD